MHHPAVTVINMADEEKKDVEVPAKFKDLVATIEKMSALDLAELVKVLEDKFGVSAAAPVMAVAPDVAMAVMPGVGDRLLRGLDGQCLG